MESRLATAAACHLVATGRAAQRRARLIATARRLFIEHGFHATGIAQIARESGIAVGQIYRDFAGKDEIVAALVTSDCGAWVQAERLGEAIRADDRDAVRGWLHDLIEPEDDPEGNRLFAEIVAESARNERIAAIFATLQVRLRANILAALACLAPGEEVAGRRALLADMLQSFSLGLHQFKLMEPALATAPLAGYMADLLDGELARLN
jgi:AcrR family transcriptional regulator